MKDLFKNAKHCRIYKTRSGRYYLYEYKTEEGHLLSPMNRSLPTILVNDNGIADKDLFSNDYDIIEDVNSKF